MTGQFGSDCLARVVKVKGLAPWPGRKS